MTNPFETQQAPSRQSRERRQLRRALRARRNALTDSQREQANAAFLRNLRTRPWFAGTRHLGFYLANDGELDPLPALLANRPRGQRLYLPVLNRRRAGHLLFVPWEPGDPLLANEYGIGEPPDRAGRRYRPLWALDVLLLPLVGFDREGNRLGMGGGFYDRTLAELTRAPRRPRLVGVAYDFQEVPEGLPLEPWDEPLDEIVTNGRVIRA